MKKPRQQPSGTSKKKSPSKKPSKRATRVDKLPPNPVKGKIYERLVTAKNGQRIMQFLATGLQGFGKYKILSNTPVKKKK